MMNLSINLTLGNPGGESVLNSAAAPEETTVDSFGLKLADELNEQELTPPIRVEDTRAVDPKLLEAIAARQKLAAEAEDTQQKDGRIWLDDPMAGLPENAAEAAELVEDAKEDKPWLDIIEKAKSYGPALQVNKGQNTEGAANIQSVLASNIAERNDAVSADIKVSFSDEVHLDTDTKPAAGSAVQTDSSVQSLVSLPDEAAATDFDLTGDDAQSAARYSAAVRLVDADLPGSESQAETVTELPAVDAKQAAPVAERLTVETDQPGLPPKAQIGVDSPSSVVAGAKLAEITSPESPNQGLPESSDTTAAEATTPTVTAPAVATSAVTNNTTAKTKTTASELLQVERSEKIVSAGAQQGAPVIEPDTTDNKSGLAMSAATAADAVVAASVKPVQQAEKASAVQLAATPAAMAADAQATDGLASVLPAPVVGQASAEKASRGMAAASNDKAPAANAFAQHLKTVNQQQLQQQQQSGAEQQARQGQAQAQATAEAIVSTQPVQPVAGTAPFAQLLPQQPVQPISEHTATASTVTQSQGQSVASGVAHTSLSSQRPAETAGWQPPLALSEPAAAQQLKDRVMVQIQHKLQTAEVQLHPEELGSMQIKLNLQQDQLSVQFVVQQGAAKEALEQQMPRLRELLEQQGIALTEGQVEQRQSGGQQEQRQSRSGHSAETGSDLSTVQTVQMKVSDRMVDFYA